MELGNLEYLGALEDCMGAVVLHFTSDVTEKKGLSSFPINTF